MLNRTNCRTIKDRSVALAMLGMMLSSTYSLPALADTPMTAGIVMKEMPVGERTSFIIGIVEGLAYARFRKDTIAAGEKDHSGLRCIYDWFYDDKSRVDVIEATFRKHNDLHPSVLLNAMIKKECGE